MEIMLKLKGLNVKQFSSPLRVRTRRLVLIFCYFCARAKNVFRAQKFCATEPVVNNQKSGAWYGGAT